jgi:putative phosphoribosyl transferase
MNQSFADRADAGRALATRLQPFATKPKLIVLAPPRGGILVGANVAGSLGAPFDAIVIRRIASPANNRITLGAIGPWGAVARNEAVISSLQLLDPAIAGAIRVERQNLELRTHWYRGDQPAPELEGATVILVDDGIVTGATMEAAARAIRSRRPAELIVATPVASAEGVSRLRESADEIVTLTTAPAAFAVADYYAESRLPDDLELRWILTRRETDRVG